MVKTNQLIAPVVKWVGGKRQLMTEITPLIPAKFSTYCEPFLGGGAVFLNVQPRKAVVNDINHDLITVYQVIKTQVESLIEDLKKHEYNKDYFYNLRNLDRDHEQYLQLDDVQRASRFIYLNKTCFNGLYRVNSKGEFNVPFGRYRNPKIVNEEVLRAVSAYLNHSKITFCNEDFEATIRRMRKGSFVYLDPPYDPLSETASFTGYNSNGFGRKEQIRLKECCDLLNRRGIKFLLSNSATDFITELYSDYEITFVKAKRAINVNTKKRGAIAEVLVRNYH